MSKAAKTRRALERRKIKAGRKAAEQAKYESYKASGANKKSKRSKIKAGQVRSIRVNRHSGPCNNVACSRAGCNGVQIVKQVFPKAKKPYRTSSEKLALYNQKLQSKRNQAKPIIVASKADIEARIAKLDERLGKDVGATRERARLLEQLKKAA